MRYGIYQAREGAGRGYRPLCCLLNAAKASLPARTAGLRASAGAEEMARRTVDKGTVDRDLSATMLIYPEFEAYLAITSPNWAAEICGLSRMSFASWRKSLRR